MRWRRHEETTIELPSRHDALATEVWRAGLPHAAAGEPLIRAPHASELVAEPQPATSHRDAA
jgi:hypothetical protein